MRKMSGFGVGIKNWHLDRAQNFAIAHMYMIGAMVMKTAKRGNWAGDGVTSTRHKIVFCCIGSYCMNKFNCA
jgi:hypothetical protein